MAKRKVKLGSKVKKKWFMAVAPAIYKNADIAEITAYEPQNLIGRAVEISLMHLTGAPKDQNKKLYLKITDTRGEKALTEPWKLILQEGYIQRASRRFKERIVSVLKLKSKDGKLVKFKLLTLIVKRLPRTLRTKISKQIEQMMTDKIAKFQSSDLFVPMSLDKLAAELKRELKQIYPVNKVLVWKLTILK